MSQTTDGQGANTIRELHDALDTVERCVRKIAEDPVRAEMIDLSLELRNCVSRMLTVQCRKNG